MSSIRFKLCLDFLLVKVSAHFFQDLKGILRIFYDKEPAYDELEFPTLSLAHGEVAAGTNLPSYFVLERHSNLCENRKGAFFQQSVKLEAHEFLAQIAE